MLQGAWGVGTFGLGPSAALMKGSFLIASLCNLARSDSCKVESHENIH